jgi:hypothetical protein
MPLKTTNTNTDVILYTDAKKLCDALASKGVPVTSLSEEIPEGGSFVYVLVTDPNWADDDAPHIFYASIWGKFQDCSSVNILMNSTSMTWLNKFISLASIAFENDSIPLTQSLAITAVENLNGVMDMENTLLSLPGFQTIVANSGPGIPTGPPIN